jgi:superkiller protein 3
LAGRHTASLRALERAKQLRPDDHLCQFQIAEVTRDLGDFQTSIEIFDELISSRPFDVVLHVARCTTKLSFSRHERESGFLERSFISCVNVIREGLLALTLQAPGTSVIWKVIGDAVFELSRWPIDEEITDGDAESVICGIVEQIMAQRASLDKRIDPFIDLERIMADCTTGQRVSELEFIAAKVAAAISCYRVHLSGSNEIAQASSCYDFALHLQELAFAHAHLLEPDIKQVILQLATEYCKRAIRLQSNEPLYWSCLGTITLDSNPKLSQHAFIRAIQCEVKVSLSRSSTHERL